MFLSKLEIQGFKSFADKVVLEFNKELTAVVGPNGSGKSNVADSVRWVLGEQSLKVLRGKKSEDVIFAGSSKRPRLGFSEVSLYLDNTEGLAPIDYREIVITRRLYRSGESEYLINKNKVRLLDIQLMLAKASFGARTYSIIGQGMIDSFITVSPVERKELFDEATGVREYQLKKEQAILKLEHAQENLAQSDQLTQEIEPRLRSLTRQVKRLERREEVEKELLDLQTNYYSQRVLDLDKKHQELDTQYQAAEAKHNQTASEIERLQKAIDVEQRSDTQAQAFQKLQNKYQELVLERNREQTELASLNSKINLDLSKMGKVDLAWLNKRQTELEHLLEATDDKLVSVTAEVEKFKKHLDLKTNEQQNILNQFKKLQAELLSAQKKLANNEKISLVAVKQHLAEVYQKQTDLIELLDKNPEELNLNKLKNKADDVLSSLKWLSEKLAETDAEAAQDVIKLQHQLNEFLATKDSLVNEIQELKLAYELKKSQQDNLTKDQTRLKDELAKIATDLSVYSGNSQEATSALTLQKQQLETKLAKLEESVAKLEQELKDFSKNQEQKKSQFIELQHNLRFHQLNQNADSQKLNEIKIELAKIDTKREDLEKEIALEYKNEFKQIKLDQPIDLNEAAAEIARLKNQLAVIGSIDEEVVKEYEEVKSRYSFLTEQSADLKQAIESCNQLIDDLEEKITKQFEEGFTKINEKFIAYFKILFNGGQTNLILQKKEITEPEDLPIEGENLEAEAKPIPIKTNKKKKFEYGIEIQATPPGKKLKSINVLSGGEKALTSIALISAIIANNPSPFVILDEVDAALDEANSDRFAKIVQELSDKTQFICITHNRATMNRAAILYGVTMGADGVSKLLSINLKEADQLAAK